MKDQTAMSMPGGGYVLAEQPARVSVQSVEIVPDGLPPSLYEESNPGVRFLLSWPEDKGFGAVEHSLRLSEFLRSLYGQEWREVVARALQEPEEAV